jgi:hypothetical protein
VTDVERLLRDTLTDPRRSVEPDPGQYDRVTVLARAYRRRQARNWAGGLLAAAAVLAVLVGIGGTVGGRPHPHPSGGPTITTTGGLTGATGTRQPVTIGDGHGLDVVAGPPLGVGSAHGTAPGVLYVLENSPARVMRLDPASAQVLASADILLDPGGLALDASAGRLWVWSRATESRTTVSEYDAANLTPLGGFTVPSYTFTAAAWDGQLWLGTGSGLYRVGDAAPGPVRVAAGGSGQVFSVAADPDRNRVLAGIANPATFAGVRVIAVDRLGGLLRTGAPLPVGKESIAVAGGRIWVGGYASGTSPRLVRLDPDTLAVAGTSPVSRQVGPGAILWPGRAVLWVRDGGDEGLSCVDPFDGSVLQQWESVQGPVASVPGYAVAVGDSGGDSGTDTSRLDLWGRCTG